MMRVRFLADLCGSYGDVQANTEKVLSDGLAETLARRGLVEILPEAPAFPAAAEPEPSESADTPEGFRCSECSREFETERGLATHVKRAHGSDEKSEA